jgi:glycosyltransferase involved in cell wall biosynthesis
MLDQLTIVVFTFNEEKRLPWVIRNFSDFARILVVDNESTDQTVEIAKAAGCNVLINKNQGWVEDALTVERVFEAAETEWIYWGFADEMIKPDSLGFISKAISSGLYDIIKLQRKNYYYGKFCYGALASYQTKFFKNEAIDFTGNKIHNFGKEVVPSNRIFLTPSDCFVGHFIDDDISSYLNKINRYTDTEAEQLEGVNSFKFFRLFFFGPLKIALLDYLIRGGFRAGTPGFVLVFTQLLYSWIKAIKLYEKRNSIKRSNMEGLYRDHKKDILQGHICK